VRDIKTSVLQGRRTSRLENNDIDVVTTEINLKPAPAESLQLSHRLNTGIRKAEIPINKYVPLHKRNRDISFTPYKARDKVDKMIKSFESKFKQEI